jgi:hypothetical protein
MALLKLSGKFRRHTCGEKKNVLAPSEKIVARRMCVRNQAAAFVLWQRQR